MPKLLQIVVEGNTGSNGTMAESIGELAIGQGWESWIAHGRFPRPSTSNLIRIGSDWSVNFHALETRLFDRHGLGSRSATRKLIMQIRQIKPDVIQMHHLHGYYVNIRILFDFLRDAGIPVVWTFHDCWSFTGHCAWFEYAGCEKWLSGCGRCPQLSEYPASMWADRSALNFAEKQAWFTAVPDMVIVGVSHWISELTRRSFFRHHRVETIHNGIDTAVFDVHPEREAVRARYAGSDQMMVLGVASPWIKRKGLDDILALSRLTGERVQYVLVGLSEEQIRSLPANVTGLTRTENRRELAALYSAADVFLNPTLEDNFPTTNLEALACGTPVVTYATGGSPEAVCDQTGVVVPQGDVTGLQQALDRISRRERTAWHVDCRARVVEKFEKKIQFGQYLALYSELIRERES
jgi:putative colanic acid biosynthesis glycosyltransferase